MITDDKTGIGYGLLGLFQDDAGFVKFVNKKWIFDADGFRAHIRKIKEVGGNFVRVLPWGVWGSHPGQKKETQFQPYVLNVAKDLWDLSKFNTYYFPIVEKAFSIINEENLSIIFALFDNCQFHGTYKKWSPWVNNVQGITNFYGKDADKYTQAWISTWIVRAKRKSFDIIWGLNEAENSAYPDFFKRIIVPYMKRGLIDPNRMTYGATTKIGPTDSIQDKVRLIVREAFKPNGAIEKNIIMEDHGYPFTASLPVWGKKPYEKLYSDDGLHPRPTASAWATRIKYILKYVGVDKARFCNFEHLPEAYPPNADFEAATIRAMKKVCEGV